MTQRSRNKLMLPSALVPVACFGRTPALASARSRRSNRRDSPTSAGQLNRNEVSGADRLRTSKGVRTSPSRSPAVQDQAVLVDAVLPDAVRPEAVLREAVRPDAVRLYAVQGQAVGGIPIEGTACMSRGDDHGQGDSSSGKIHLHSVSPFRLTFAAGDWGPPQATASFSTREAIPIVLVRECDGRHKEYDPAARTNAALCGGRQRPARATPSASHSALMSPRPRELPA